MVGLENFNINDWKYLVAWKKSTSKQVLRFQSVSVYCIIFFHRINLIKET